MFVVALRFLIVGPAAGALGFVLADQLLDIAGLSTSSLAHPGSVVSVPVLWLYGLVLAYPLGLIPAALSAFAFVKLSRSGGTVQRLLVAGAIGLCLASLFGLTFFSFAPSVRALALVSWAVAGLFGGVASGLACVGGSVQPSANANVA